MSNNVYNITSLPSQVMVAWKAALLAAGVYKSICTWDKPSDIAEVRPHSVLCMCYSVLCMCYSVLCMCYSVLCMCCSVLCMCYSVLCMCYNRRGIQPSHALFPYFSPFICLLTLSSFQYSFTRYPPTISTLIL